MDDTLGDGSRLDADRDHGGPGQLRDQHQRVAARHASDGTELVAGDQDQPAGDPPGRQPGGRPPGRVGLVGQPHLDVLAVTRDPGVDQAGLTGPGLGEADDLRQPGDPGPPQPGGDRLEQTADVRLGRVGPRRLGDEVDLAPVEPFGHHPGLEAPLVELPDDHLGGPVERSVLLLVGGAAKDQLRPGGGDLEDLRTPVEAQMQPARPRGSSPQLTVDVADVGAGDNHDVHARGAEGLDAGAYGGGVRGAIGDGGAVPVEDQRLEHHEMMIAPQPGPSPPGESCGRPWYPAGTGGTAVPWSPAKPPGSPPSRLLWSPAKPPYGCRQSRQGDDRRPVLRRRSPTAPAR